MKILSSFTFSFLVYFSQTTCIFRNPYNHKPFLPERSFKIKSTQNHMCKSSERMAGYFGSKYNADGKLTYHLYLNVVSHKQGLLNQLTIVYKFVFLEVELNCTQSVLKTDLGWFVYEYSVQLPDNFFENNIIPKETHFVVFIVFGAKDTLYKCSVYVKNVMIARLAENTSFKVSYNCSQSFKLSQDRLCDTLFGLYLVRDGVINLGNNALDVSEIKRNIDGLEYISIKSHLLDVESEYCIIMSNPLGHLVLISSSDKKEVCKSKKLILDDVFDGWLDSINLLSGKSKTLDKTEFEFENYDEELVLPNGKEVKRDDEGLVFEPKAVTAGEKAENGKDYIGEGKDSF
jgi:hypothetical protein